MARIAGSVQARSRTELAAMWPPTAAVASEAGHMPMPALRAIRLKCLDCSAGQPMEVRLCESVSCVLWPFRSGRHPYRKSPANTGTPRERGPGGAWIPADRSSRKKPPIGGGFSESGQSDDRPSVSAASSPANRLLEADLGERTTRGTQVPEGSSTSKNFAVHGGISESETFDVAGSVGDPPALLLERP